MAGAAMSRLPHWRKLFDEAESAALTEAKLRELTSRRGLPAPSPPNKRHAGGRPPDYPIEIIGQIARDYIEVYGKPRTQLMLCEKVRDECERNGFKVPGETRFKQMMRPIYRGASRRKS
jgi:hypothetical protein